MRPLSAWPICLLLLFLPLAGTGAAPPAGLRETPACRAALAALVQEEDALIARRAADAAPGENKRPGQAAQPASRLNALQAAAARSCLGSEHARPRAVMPAQPQTLAPGSTRPAAVPVLPALRPSAAAGAAPVRQAPLLTVTGCDAQGCWASDGSRLQRLGPALIGPRGHCSQIGAVLSCP